MKHNIFSQTGMKMLTKSDTIETGIYAGMTVKSCLNFYGKRAIPEILKYYDLSPEIMKEYHCHLQPHEEKVPVVKTEKERCCEMTQDSVIEPSYVTDITDSEDAFDTEDLVNLDDNDSWVSDLIELRNNILYDPEDDMVDSAYYDNLTDGSGVRLNKNGNRYCTSYGTY